MQTILELTTEKAGSEVEMKFPKMHRLIFGVITMVTTCGVIALLSMVPVSAQSALTVTGVTQNNSSVRVFYQPFAGAKDYRIYDVAAPNDVKYAGLVHLAPSATCPGSSCFSHFRANADGSVVFPYQSVSGASGGPQVLDTPATDIEWNGLDNQPHTLVVEAVDQLGPVPQSSLYSGLQNVPIISGGMLGSNKGPTGDGKISTNGEGPYTNSPHVIARSQSFIVQTTTVVPIPSGPSASQTFFDGFGDSEGSSLQQISRSDNTTDSFNNLGQMAYSLNAGTDHAWDIQYRQADNKDSMPFISKDHFMDMIFDGATPNSSAPTHTAYGSMSMSPAQTVTMGNGVLHMTMEVDAHQTFRRWVDFNLAPASDPLQRWDFNGNAINNTNRGIFLELKDGGCTLDIFNGPSSGAPSGSAGGSAHGARLWGGSGSVGGAPIMCGWDQMYNPSTFVKNGLGLDDRSRLDFFLSATHAALYEDGHLVVQSDIPAGSFPWANVPLKMYFSHYLYHSDADLADIDTYNINGQTMCYPENSYWYNAPTSGTAASQTVCNTAYPAGFGFPYSDERHWDNMGLEVLPDFSTAQSISSLQSPQPPHFSGQPLPTSTATSVVSTPTGTAVATTTPTATVASTQTAVVPTDTPTVQPTDTPVPVGTCELLARVDGVLKFVKQKDMTPCAE